MRKHKALYGVFAIVLASLAFSFIGCKTQLVVDGGDETGRSVTGELPCGLIKVENGMATLEVGAYNQAVDLMTRSILPSIGNQIYFTIVASTRKYGYKADGSVGEDLKSSESANPLYIAHATYVGHANYAADFAVLDTGTGYADSNGDNYPDGMDLAKPFFATTTGIPAAQSFTLKTNTQWYFTAYGTSVSPKDLAINRGIGSLAVGASDQDFEDAQETWSWAEWSALVSAIQSSAKIVGDLPLYIKDNGNSSVAGASDQIELLDTVSTANKYTTGLEIETNTQNTKTGHFLVPVTVPAGASESDPQLVKYVKLDWTPTSVAATPTALTPEAGSITWSRAAGQYNAAQSFAFYPEVAEGDYTVTLNFFNSDPAVGTPEPIYEIAEDTLTVWGNVDSTPYNSTGTPNKNWYGSVTFTNATILRIGGSPDTTVPDSLTKPGYVIQTSDIAQFHRTRFYVSNGAGDALKKANGTPTGSIFAPFDTIADAVAVIQTDATLKETLWYIVVDGTPADSSAVTITNPAGAGDYRLIIQSYKPTTETTLTNDFNFYNNENDSATSALRVVLRNISINANLNVGTEDLILDNAKINATGTGKVSLMTAVADTNQQGILNVALSDTTSTAKNITSTIQDPKQVTVLRSYTINYNTPLFEPALKNPYNNGTAQRATYIDPEGTAVGASEKWNERFLLDSTYANVTINTSLVSPARVLAQNTTNFDPYEGCLTIKSPQSVTLTFGKGLFATDVLSSSGDKLTYGTVAGYGSGWIVKPNATYGSTDVTAAKTGAKIDLTLAISVESLSPSASPANDNTNVKSALMDSFQVFIKDGSDSTVNFEKITSAGSPTKAYYVTQPSDFEAGHDENSSQLVFTITLTGDLVDPELPAKSAILWVTYTLNGLKYASPYEIIIVNTDA